MKLAAAGLGVGIALIGVVQWRFGGRLTTALNKLYARSPGKFQYPPSWHRLVGGMFIAFGAFIAIVGAVMAGR